MMILMFLNCNNKHDHQEGDVLSIHLMASGASSHLAWVDQENGEGVQEASLTQEAAGLEENQVDS